MKGCLYTKKMFFYHFLSPLFLNQGVLKGTRTIPRGGRGITAPNLPSLIGYSIQLKNRKNPCAVGVFSDLNLIKQSDRYLRAPCVVYSRSKVYSLLLVSICNHLIGLKIILTL